MMMAMDHLNTEKENLCQILQNQFHRHMNMEVIDLYKLIYQITYGPNHLLENQDQAKAMLREEWENTEKIVAGETLLEVIDPLDQIIRINLRIYKKVGGKSDHLFNLMVQSAQLFQKDGERLIRYWNWITEWARNPEWFFPKKDLDHFWAEMEKEHFPMCHHSKSYIDANRPSYRIVLKHLWMDRESNGKGI